jgi:hypothetical protein
MPNSRRQSRAITARNAVGWWETSEVDKYGFCYDYLSEEELTQVES